MSAICSCTLFRKSISYISGTTYSPIKILIMLCSCSQDPSNWPDVVPTSKQNFETMFSIHVVSAILLVISFFRAVFTNPGSIPNNNTWREASGLQFPLKEQEQKFLALLKVPHRVASTKARKESTCFLNIPDHTAYLKNLLVTERKFLDGVEKEMTTSAMGTVC